jgi:hypothetical protein
MIILRQKEFAFGGFDWAFDSDGKLRTDMSEEDHRKFEAMKKKHPDEWKEFQRKQREKPKDNANAYQDYYKASKEHAENRRKEAIRTKEAFGISMGTWGADIVNSALKGKARENRKQEVDEIVGHDKRMKKSDRSELNILKTKSKKSKQALADSLNEKKSTKERDKAAKKYVRREAWDKAEEGLFRGANIGSSVGRLGGMMKEANDNFGKHKTSYGKTELTGTLVGTGVGAGVGALRWGLRSKKANKKILEGLRNAKDQEKAKSKVKVARGEMTESEFVEKHGGKEK